MAGRAPAKIQQAIEPCWAVDQGSSESPACQPGRSAHAMAPQRQPHVNWHRCSLCVHSLHCRCRSCRLLLSLQRRRCPLHPTAPARQRCCAGCCWQPAPPPPAPPLPRSSAAAGARRRCRGRHYCQGPRPLPAAHQSSEAPSSAPAASGCPAGTAGCSAPAAGLHRGWRSRREHTLPQRYRRCLHRSQAPALQRQQATASCLEPGPAPAGWHAAPPARCCPARRQAATAVAAAAAAAAALAAAVTRWALQTMMPTRGAHSCRSCCRAAAGAANPRQRSPQVRQVQTDSRRHVPLALATW